MKLFYDNFTPDEICGMFTLPHFIAMFSLLILLIVAIYFSHKMSVKVTKRVLFGISIIVIVMEIVKISLRIYKGQSGDSWIPLYFCSLFLYACVLINLPWKRVQDIGWSYIVFGGVVASIGFIIMPSTSLALFPIWHPGSIHSMIYHWLMAYSGIIAIVNKIYMPKLWHFVYYFYFTGFFSVIAVVVNSMLNTNMMFLSNPFGISWLQAVINYSPTLYALLAYFAQCVALYFASYLIYFIYTKISYRLYRRKNGSI